MNDLEGYRRFRQDFASILDNRFYTLAWLDGQVADNSIRCWSDSRAAILATIKTYPTGARELHGMAAAGHLPSIPPLIALAEQWGREHGCLEACIDSRPGWERVMKDYHLSQVTIRKAL